MNIRADCMLDILTFLDSAMAVPYEEGPPEVNAGRRAEPVHSGIIMGSEQITGKYQMPDILISMHLLITMQLLTASKPPDANNAPVWLIHSITPRGQSFLTTKLLR